MEREFWFTQVWSARERGDGTLEPHAPISAVGIGHRKDSDIVTPSVQRGMLEQFGNIAPGEPFFTIEAKFSLVNT